MFEEGQLTNAADPIADVVYLPGLTYSKSLTDFRYSKVEIISISCRCFFLCPHIPLREASFLLLNPCHAK